ncbi:MBL fold metallo-hydrolase [Roseibium algae]|uniref:MBL fold metallo-hydrolase n=1 Tax=Roseibium algae TaxID=3123038 RepID=A0ABU8TGY2_9HYPH
MSDTQVQISRRTALLGAGGAAAGVVLMNSAPSLAAADKQSALHNPVARYGVGEFEVNTLMDGAVPVSAPQKTFGMNVAAEEFAAVSSNNFISADSFKTFFTPTLINTGSELILFDTGVGAGGRPARGNMRAAVESAGYTPEQVDIVVLTHMHPDHIGGLFEGAAPAFPNARYITGAKEYDFWAKMDPEANGVTKLLAKNVKPLAEKMTFLNDGGAVTSGITAVAAEGHTPGHMIYMVENGGKQLLLAADTANHYVWSLAKPDWEVRFDMDKEAAAATRRKVLGMLAADKTPFIGYHMPFPAVGFVEVDGDGFRYVAESYQLSL